MATTSSETSRADTIVRDKAVRLFTYLKELTELRSEVVPVVKTVFRRQ